MALRYLVARRLVSVALQWSVVAGPGLCALPSAEAAPVTVVNPSFEDTTGATMFNEFYFGPLPGWGFHDPSGLKGTGGGNTYFIGTLQPSYSGQPAGSYPWFPDGPTDGQRVAIAFNYAAGGGTGEYGLVQTLGDVLLANTTYTLQVDIGNIASGVAVNNAPFNLAGFPGYRVDLLAGGVVIASDINSLNAIAEGEFATSTIEFTTGDIHAQLGQYLGIRLVNLNVVDVVGADLEVDFDNVRLDATPIPEPASAALLAAMLAGLRRRRR